MSDLQTSAPVARPPHAFWEEMHRVNAFYGNDCATQCKSYCCNSNSKHFAFSMMKANSAGMVFMGGEYDFLKQTGRLQKGFLEAARSWSFPFDDNRALHFNTSVCSLGGICSLPEYRPFICKFYPFLPVLKETGGDITDFFPCSVLDLYWRELGLEQPCWVATHRRPDVEAALRKYQPFLRHPYVIFYLTAARLFGERLRSDLKTRHGDLLKGTPGQFFSRWEVLYLGGQIIDGDAYRAELRDLYRRMADHHGPFEL